MKKIAGNVLIVLLWILTSTLVAVGVVSVGRFWDALDYVQQIQKQQDDIVNAVNNNTDRIIQAAGLEEECMFDAITAYYCPAQLNLETVRLDPLLLNFCEPIWYGVDPLPKGE